MSILSVTYTFNSGAVVRSSEHNQNMLDIISWANGNITETNFGVFAGELSWNITTNTPSISSTNTGNAGSIILAHNGALSAGNSALKVSSSSAQSAGSALVEISSSSGSMNLPSLKITDTGSGGRGVIEVISTTKASLPFPKMTTSQRNAMTAPSEGCGIYNSTTKRYEMYNGTNWVDMQGRTGESVIYRGGTIPPDRLAEDGSAVSRTTYAALFAVVGTTYGVGDGATTFNLPDSRGRVDIGDGTGAGLTARVLAATGGEETHVLSSSEMAAHTHTLSGTTGSSGAHTHGTPANGGAGAVRVSTAGGTNGTADYSPLTDSQGSHTHTFSGTSDSTGSGTAHNIMQPFLVAKKCIII